ncbi:hypothetical protein BDQ12DRAFT_682568 [Crucibulum laeve]|uniref:Uncharacterized protein n=1 Tax=Crucibulum laeve TaxID=68775 RepID=A0A5C3M429_9AGAR|nr:hypothetical protein BDQ12DRAFT_682568 [Crucibulum laeve]
MTSCARENSLCYNHYFPHSWSLPASVPNLTIFSAPTESPLTKTGTGTSVERLPSIHNQ